MKTQTPRLHWKYKRLGDVVFSIIDIGENQYIQAKSVKMPTQKLIEGVK